MSSREWQYPDKAPGGEVARLRAVRVRTEDGQSTETIDIRRKVGLEMEYEVLKPGYKLMPVFGLYNEEGVRLFDSVEHDPAWRGRVRPPGAIEVRPGFLAISLPREPCSLMWAYYPRAGDQQFYRTPGRGVLCH